MEIIKTTIVLFVLALGSLTLSEKAVRTLAITDASAAIVRPLFALWIIVIVLLSFSPAGVLNVVIAAATIFIFKKTIASAPLASIIFLIFTIPELENRIPGILGLDSLFLISWPLMVFMCVVMITRSKSDQKDFRHGKSIIAFIIFGTLFTAMQFRADSFTEGLRQAIYYGSMFLLAFQITRKLDSSWVEEVLIGLVLVGILLGSIAIFETLRSWLLYTPMISANNTGAFSTISPYKFRDGWLRSHAAHGSLVTGLATSSAIIAMISLRSKNSKNFWQAIAIGIVFFGLMATHARGPLLVFGAMAALFVILKKAPKLLQPFLYIVIPLIILLEIANFWGFLLNVLGLQGDFNVQYRLALAQESWRIIGNNFFNPNANYIAILDGAGLREGEGIVDVVNTYLQIGLEFGGFALLLFVSILASGAFTFAKELRLGGIYRRHETASLVGAFVIYLNIVLQIASVSELGFTSTFSILLIVAILFSRKGVLVPVRGECVK